MSLLPASDSNDSPEDTIKQHATVDEIRSISTYWRRLIAVNLFMPIGYLLTMGALFAFAALNIPHTAILLGTFGLSVVFARLLVPYYLYRDSKALAASQISPGWTPSRLYALAALVPLPPFGFAVSIIYLTFRIWYYRVPAPPSLSSIIPSRLQ